MRETTSELLDMLIANTRIVTMILIVIRKGGFYDPRYAGCERAALHDYRADGLEHAS